MLQYKWVHKYHYTDNITILFADCQRKMFGAFLFFKFCFFSLLQLFTLYLTFYLFIIICRKRGFHMPAERKKHLAKEISTPDARGLKGCRKRLLQPNQPK